MSDPVESTAPSPTSPCGSGWGCGGDGSFYVLETNGDLRPDHCACPAGRALAAALEADYCDIPS